MKKLNVPYYSQRLDVLDPEWKHRSCGICVLKMAMEFLGLPAQAGGEKINLGDLIKEGLKNNAYLKNIGWIHQGLVELAKKHGFENTFRKEWPRNKKNEAVKYLTELLEKEIPVLASVKNKDEGHLVLIVGAEIKGNLPEGFYIHDPNAYSVKEGKFKFLNLQKFLRIWKGRIIILGR